MRGVSGTSVDRDRHDGIHETLDKTGKKWDIIEVYGKWDDPTAQKVTADAIAVQKHFDGYHRPGRRHRRRAGDASTPSSRSAPFGGETENGFRKFCAKYRRQGLKCSSGGTGPAQVAVAIKIAIAALEGQVVPQSVKLPLATAEDPNFKDGENYYAAQSDNFFVGNSFPTCNINFTRAGDHGADEGEQVAVDARRRGRQRPRRSREAAACGSLDFFAARFGGVTRAGADGLADPADGGRVQALRRRARARQRRSRRLRGAHSRDPRRERRGQVDADQDPRPASSAPDAGRIVLDGAEVAFDSPAAANRAGIVCIFQELSLVPDLSVADNIAISNPPRRFGLIDRRAQRRIAEEALARAGAPDIHPMALVKDLPLSRRQMVEIAKALARKPRVLILDEATSALTAADVAKVFVVLKRLRQEGLALLYISHRMHEIAELADECTVFRNGSNVATYAAGTKTDNEVVEMMIGREYSHIFPPKPPPRVRRRDAAARSQEPRAGRTACATFRSRAEAGEVVGLGGLDGQGQRELLLALFGVLRGVSGEIRVAGAPVSPSSPHAAKAKRSAWRSFPRTARRKG